MFNRTSSVTALISYFMLYFTGILTPLDGSLGLIGKMFPYYALRNAIMSPSYQSVCWIVAYGMIYWSVGTLLFSRALTMAKKEGVFFMFSEMKRYMTYRVRYLFDSICDVIYSFIFITGIIVIVDSKAPINILYFFTYYLITNVILLANEELEYEIRTNQYMNIKTTKQTPLMIYIYRSGTYFIWSALIF